MAEKWTVKEESGRGKSLPLYYAVYSADGHLVSMHYAQKDAEVMAAVPRLLQALESLERTAGLPSASDDPARVEARAAIAAAKGE